MKKLVLESQLTISIFPIHTFQSKQGFYRELYFRRNFETKLIELIVLKVGVGYKRKNKPQFWHFLFDTQAVKISRSS